MACMPCATPPAHARSPQGLALAGAADAQQGEAAADDDGAAEAAAGVQARVGIHYSLCRETVLNACFLNQLSLHMSRALGGSAIVSQKCRLNSLW